MDQFSGGGSVAMEGALKAELYDSGGEIELSVGVIAEHVLPLRQPGCSRQRSKLRRPYARRSNAQPHEGCHSPVMWQRFSGQAKP